MEMFVRYMGRQLQHCRNNTHPVYHFDSLSSLVVLNEDDDIDIPVDHRPLEEDAVKTPMSRRWKSRVERQHWPTARFLKIMAHDEDDALHLTFPRMAFPISDYGSRESDHSESANGNYRGSPEFRALSVSITSNVGRTKQPLSSNKLNGGTAYLQAEFTVRQSTALILGCVQWSCVS